MSRLAAFVRWVSFILDGAPVTDSRPCEYRRPASITCYRHGQRKRSANRAA